MIRLIVGLLFAVTTGAAADRVFRVESPAQLEAVRSRLSGREGPAEGSLTIRLAAGEYMVRESLRILRSNVALIGEPGAKLRLAGGVNQPVIAIGSQREIPTEAERIRRVLIRGIEINGNRRAQTSEIGRERPWIRNNGIDVRMASRVAIEEVRITGCRSGGLVISWGCADVRVKDSTFTDSFFDGVAYYDSRKIATVRCVMAGNRGAGVSADNRFAASRFVDCRIVDNGDVGIFLRASRDILFERCEIARSGNWAAFLAHDETGDGTHGVWFVRCHFADNRGGVRMASVNEAQSSRTEISRCAFRGNAADGRANVDSAGSAVRERANAADSTGAP